MVACDVTCILSLALPCMGSLTAPCDQGDCPLECEDEAFWTCEWLACHEHGVVRSAFVEWCEMVCETMWYMTREHAVCAPDRLSRMR